MNAGAVVRTHLNSVATYDTSGTYELTFGDADNPIIFSANCSTTDVENDYYYLPIDSGNFSKNLTDTQSSSNQAILKVPSSSNTEIATSVEEITVTLKKTAEGIYTLGGIRLCIGENELAPGIYIVNGEKKLVK